MNLVSFEGMRQLAAQRQWKLDPADPGVLDTTPFQRVSLEGSAEGIPLHFECAASLGKYTTTGFFQPPLPWTFVITHQGLFGDLANLIGFKDVETGTQDFDRTFRVISKEVDRTRALLTPEVQTQLKRLDAAARGFGSRFEVTEHAVSFTRAMLTVALDTEDDVLHDLPAVLGVIRALREASRSAF